MPTLCCCLPTEIKNLQSFYIPINVFAISSFFFFFLPPRVYLSSGFSYEGTVCVCVYCDTCGFWLKSISSYRWATGRLNIGLQCYCETHWRWCSFWTVTWAIGFLGITLTSRWKSMHSLSFSPMATLFFLLLPSFPTLFRFCFHPGLTIGPFWLDTTHSLYRVMISW